MAAGETGAGEGRVPRLTVVVVTAPCRVKPTAAVEMAGGGRVMQAAVVVTAGSSEVKKSFTSVSGSGDGLETLAAAVVVTADGDGRETLPPAVEMTSVEVRGGETLAAVVVTAGSGDGRETLAAVVVTACVDGRETLASVVVTACGDGRETQPPAVEMTSVEVRGGSVSSSRWSAASQALSPPANDDTGGVCRLLRLRGARCLLFLAGRLAAGAWWLPITAPPSAAVTALASGPRRLTLTEKETRSPSASVFLLWAGLGLVMAE